MGEQLYPTTGEVNTFLETLRAHRERLTELAQQSAGAAAEELMQAIDEIGEQLLVADEELRAQSEHLSQSAHRLDLLVAAYEELFANAPVAYLETDADGVVLRMNRAARRLLNLPPGSRRTRTLVGLLRPEDHAPVRGLISRVRSGRMSASFRDRPLPIEVAVPRPDGTELPALLSVRRSTADTGAATPTLHWELEVCTPSANGPAVPLSRAPAPTFELIAELAAELAEEDSPEETLAKVAAQARVAVPSCDSAGVILVRRRGRIETPAATGQLAAACDRLQHDLNEGPCLKAIESRAPLRVMNLTDDPRWPRFGPRAARLGARSVLAVPFAIAYGTTAAVNLYSTGADRFDGEDERVARAFATHAGIALAHADMAANLRTGLLTREEIGRAVGILMERHRVTANAAFDMLVLASQHSHRKLRDLAAWMNETGEDPSSLIRDRRLS